MNSSAFKVASLSIYACMSQINFGFQLGIMNLSFIYFKEIYNFESLDDIQQTRLQFYFNILPPLFGCVGSILIAFPMAKNSRRKLFIILDIFGIIISLLSLIRSYIVLLITRILIGMVIGANSLIVPIFINEISSKEIIGFSLCINQIFINIGFSLSYLFSFGLYILKESGNSKQNYQNQLENWSIIMMCVPALLYCIRLIIFSFFIKHDTPVNYYKLNEEFKAEKAIENLYYQTFSEKKRKLIQFNKLAKSFQDRALYHSVTWRELKDPNIKKFMLIAGTLMILSAFSGINTFLVFKANIFLSAFSDSTDIQYSFNFQLVLSISLMIGACIGSILLKYIGRKVMLKIGFLIMSSSLFLQGCFIQLCFQEKDSKNCSTPCKVFLNIFLMSFIFGFGTFIGPITYLYNSEILPEKGFAISNAMNWFCVSLSLLGFQFVQTNKNIQFWAIYILFAMINVYGYMFYSNKLIETKLLELNEILQPSKKEQEDQNLQNPLKKIKKELEQKRSDNNLSITDLVPKSNFQENLEYLNNGSVN